MNISEKYLLISTNLRIALNDFLLENGETLSNICKNVIKSNEFNYTKVAKWLPAKPETNKSIYKIKSKKQLDTLLVCLIKCLNACGHYLGDKNGTEVFNIDDINSIPFYDIKTKKLLTFKKHKGETQNIQTAYTPGEIFEKNNPNCIKYLMIQVGTVTGINKSHVYLMDNDHSATLFNENSNKPTIGTYIKSNMESVIINSLLSQKDAYWQIIFQQTKNNKDLYEGVYSLFESKSGKATCGKVFLIKSGKSEFDNNTLLNRAYEYLLFDTGVENRKTN